MNVCKTLNFWFTFPLSISGSFSIFGELDFVLPSPPTPIPPPPPPPPFPCPLHSFWSELLVPRNVFKMSPWVNIPNLYIPSSLPPEWSTLSHKNHSWCFFHTSCQPVCTRQTALGILQQQFPWLCGAECESLLGLQAVFFLFVSGSDHKPACPKVCWLTCSATPFEAWGKLWNNFFPCWHLSWN